MEPHYYNEFDPYVAEWLRNLINAGLLPAGDVDQRSICDVHPLDLLGYRQCHFFAGIGGWSLAARLAGWPEDRELWTGSCPCQPFSVAGAQKGQADERHLWPEQFRLIRAMRPAVWMGEQVAAAVGKNWLDGVCSDLESVGYACGAAVVPACAVDAPHRRDRLWIVAESGALDHDDNARLERHAGDEPGARRRCDGPSGPIAETGCGGSAVEYGQGERCGQVGENAAGRAQGSGAREVARSAGADRGAVADAEFFVVRGCGPGATVGSQAGMQGTDGQRQWIWPDARPVRLPGAWSNAGWVIGHDGKARRVEPSIQLLAHGVPARVGRLRAYGNAIVPQVAAEVIAAFMAHRP